MISIWEGPCRHYLSLLIDRINIFAPLCNTFYVFIFALAISRGWLNALLCTIPQLPKEAIKREVKNNIIWFITEQSNL